MPRRTLKVLKACWAALAWLLLLTGVIGCDTLPQHMPAHPGDAGVPAATADTGIAPAPSDVREAGPEIPARPTFQFYGESIWVYMGSYSNMVFTDVFQIHASGEVTEQGFSGQATPAELAAFVGIATGPETVAAFARTDECPHSPLDPDGIVHQTLTFEDTPIYTRDSRCPGLASVSGAAHTLLDAVRARAGNP